MMCIRAMSVAPLLGCVVWLGTGSVLAQTPTQQDNVEVIMSPREKGAPSRVRDFFRSVKQRIGKLTGQVLPFTKCEKWSVPKASLEAVRKEAAKRGVVVTELGTDWNRIMRLAPADTKLDP